MKIKYIAIYTALGVAFLAVSLWVILSGGKNAKAIRTKYRLGGLMLTVAGMISVASCSGGAGGVMCYDPVLPEYVTYKLSDKSFIIHSGDEIEITIKDSPYDSHSYRITGENVLIQEGELGKAKSTYKITIVDTDYKGEAILYVFATIDNKEHVLGNGLYLKFE